MKHVPPSLKNRLLLVVTESRVTLSRGVVLLGIYIVLNSTVGKLSEKGGNIECHASRRRRWRRSRFRG